MTGMQPAQEVAMTIRRLPLWLLAAALASAWSPTSARADSLLANGFFDGDTSGWTNGIDSPIYDSAIDADGDPASGSAELDNTAAFAQGASGFWQCIPTQPGVEYFAASKIRFTPLESKMGFARLVVTFFSSANCAPASSLESQIAPEITAADHRGEWVESDVGDFQSGFVAPAGSTAALVHLVLFKQDAGGTLSINVDNVTLAEVGVPLCHGRAATIFGTSGSETLIGTPGPDVIVGLGGKDKIYGKGGDDLICGGAGDDKIFGGAGNDTIYGGGGNDILKGGTGKDRLFGGDGNDVLRGGSGDDALIGGAGSDECHPGGGDSPSEKSCDPGVVLP